MGSLSALQYFLYLETRLHLFSSSSHSHTTSHSHWLCCMSLMLHEPEWGTWSFMMSSMLFPVHHLCCMHCRAAKVHLKEIEAPLLLGTATQHSPGPPVTWVNRKNSLLAQGLRGLPPTGTGAWSCPAVLPAWQSWWESGSMSLRLSQPPSLRDRQPDQKVQRLVSSKWNPIDCPTYSFVSIVCHSRHLRKAFRSMIFLSPVTSPVYKFFYLIQAWVLIPNIRAGLR